MQGETRNTGVFTNRANERPQKASGVSQAITSPINHLAY